MKLTTTSIQSSKLKNIVINMRVLLVEPNFPIPPKSKNHKNFLPIGLLKLAKMHMLKGNEVKLIRGNLSPKEIRKVGNNSWYIPDEILITTLFTYWKKYVVECVKHYDNLFPSAKIVLGGIYASLMPEDCKKIPGVDEVWKGVVPEAETCFQAYELVEGNPKPNPKAIDYQIIQTTRGCNRKCNFCGTWKIEPIFTAKKSIREEISKKKIVFYDNNIAMNPYFENILDELIELKRERKIIWCESQSGFDGRELLKKPNLARKIKLAGFINPRIAWDGKLTEAHDIKKQIEILLDGGYKRKDIFVFMLYNWEIPFDEMEKKRIRCYDWGVQIADCRYRPLDFTYDEFNSRIIGQSNKDYYIHEKAGWTDALVKQFRKNVRRQNICVRHGFPFYSKQFETMSIPKEKILKILNEISELKTSSEKKKYLLREKVEFWFPSEITYPMH